MASEDYEAFFDLMDRKLLVELTHHALGVLRDEPAEPGSWLELVDVGAIRASFAAVEASAKRYQENRSREASLAHRDVVKAHTAELKRLARESPDLVALIARIERHRRRTSNGGTVSSTMFRDERLEALVVDGKKATAFRRASEGRIGPIRFVKKRDGWRIAAIR